MAIDTLQQAPMGVAQKQRRRSAWADGGASAAAFMFAALLLSDRPMSMARRNDPRNGPRLDSVGPSDSAPNGLRGRVCRICAARGAGGVVRTN
ncbi:MAG: hypothetical protein LCI02_08350 [Proteobacteria bacterium]|nr:hypothetical protein [Pseudomonadota bacterium]